MPATRRPKKSDPPKRTRAVGSVRVADRNTLWRTVAARLEKEIFSGNLPSGSKLASETVMARQFGVNRHTLRRAIAELLRKGLVRAQPPSGNFVAPLRIPYDLGDATLIASAISRAGFVASARLLSQRICTPPPAVAHQLAVADRTQVIELDLLRLANDIPVSYVTVWLPADRFAGIGKLFELTGSLRRSLAKAGVSVSRRKTARLTSRLGDSAECDRLGLAPDAILFALEVLEVDHENEPNAVFLYRFSALRTEFVLQS